MALYNCIQFLCIRPYHTILTFCEWNKIIMGPINDEQGIEQGGVSSSDLYKIHNNEELSVPQETDFGVNLTDEGDVHVASIGQADDTVLISNDLVKLKFLLQLTVAYCKKNHVQLSSSKTKLMMYTPSQLSGDKEYLENSVPITIDGIQIPFTEVAEHVGVVRSIHGNLPHILNRISSHQKAVHSVLPAGLARAHRGNPAASLRVEKLYGAPVLLSGTASLLLKQVEIAILDSHYKKTLLNLQKLHDKTPDPFVYFMAGSLPATAQLHLKQLSIFSMITRLPNNILNKIGRHRLTTDKDSSKSWFMGIKTICSTYLLPHPLALLDSPPTKESAKQLFKEKVIDYWQTRLRKDTAELPSLRYFKPQYMSLSKPHPLWVTAGNNSYEVCKSVIQIKMLSGRYRSDWLARHFSNNNSGLCVICTEEVPGTIEHILIQCESLTNVRMNLVQYLNEDSQISEIVKSLITPVLQSTDVSTIVQLLLDCSTLPDVITAIQIHGETVLEELFRFTRTWCFSIHKKRLQLQERWTKYT